MHDIRESVGLRVNQGCSSARSLAVGGTHEGRRSDQRPVVWHAGGVKKSGRSRESKKEKDDSGQSVSRSWLQEHAGSATTKSIEKQVPKPGPAPGSYQTAPLPSRSAPVKRAVPM